MAGGHDQSHEHNESPECAHAQATRTENEKGQDQLDDENTEEREPLEPSGHLRRPPACPHGNGLREVMEVQRRALEPRIETFRVVSVKLHHAGLEHQTEQQPPDQQSSPARRFARAAGEITPPRNTEHGQQTGFEKQCVPLEIQKDGNGRGERQIAGPSSERAERGDESEHKQQRG